ncbi:24066_t:CDS:1 [Racocetra persica]|uniref:24066_t:CDS:1 n=1 Tax=Racocetra persica TaxID=160502 RepID=A0ACA9PLU0_9GLOM|nr:24066_t:CDS:1 [Racocetra persica]
MSSSSLDSSLSALGAQPMYSSAQEGGDTFSKGKQVNGKDDSSTNSSMPAASLPQQENGKLSHATTSGPNQQLRIYQNHDDPTEEVDESPFINPISFLNTMHQKLKTTAPPVYSFSHDATTGQFYCQVHFCGQTYQNQTARPKKQQAKEEVASIAMRDLSLRMSDITALIRTDLIRAHVAASQKAKFGGGKNQPGNGAMVVHSRQMSQQITPHPLELIPKSVQWYRKQTELANNGQPKRPCVLLLEFCQMHKLGQPVYSMRDDGRGNYLFDCTIAGRVFNPEIALWHKNDAKDHVSSIAFNVLYGECVAREYREIELRYHQPQLHGAIPPPYGNSMALYSTADGGYFATPGSLVPANPIYVQNNLIPSHSHSIPRTS